MLFIVSWTGTVDKRDAVLARFKQTGGLPPANVKMLGRWVNADGCGGMAVTEADDVAGLAKWSLDWSDLITIQITPALTDEAFAKLL